MRVMPPSFIRYQTSHPIMYPLPFSKSSPLKRDAATRILTPQYNQSLAPSDDVFTTGLLTPQASQNTIESDAAKSLISPPPEDTARTGTSRTSVRFIPYLPVQASSNQTPWSWYRSPHGEHLALTLPLIRDKLPTMAVHPSANVLHFPLALYTIVMSPFNLSKSPKQVPIRNLVNSHVGLTLHQM
jgi:hypothetical protein